MVTDYGSKNHVGPEGERYSHTEYVAWLRKTAKIWRTRGEQKQAEVLDDKAAYFDTAGEVGCPVCMFDKGGVKGQQGLF